MRPFDFMPTSYSHLSREQRDEILSRTLDQVGLTEEAARIIEKQFPTQLTRWRSLILQDLTLQGHDLDRDPQRRALFDALPHTQEALEADLAQRAAQATGDADAWARYSAFTNEAGPELERTDMAVAAFQGVSTQDYLRARRHSDRHTPTLRANQLVEVLRYRHAADPDGPWHPDNVHETADEWLTYEDEYGHYEWSKDDTDGVRYTLEDYWAAERLALDQDLVNHASEALMRIQVDLDRVTPGWDSEGFSTRTITPRTTRALVELGRSATRHVSQMLETAPSVSPRELVEPLASGPWDTSPARHEVRARVDDVLRESGLPLLAEIEARMDPAGLREPIEHLMEAITQDNSNSQRRGHLGFTAAQTLEQEMADAYPDATWMHHLHRNTVVFAYAENHQLLQVSPQPDPLGRIAGYSLLREQVSPETGTWETLLERDGASENEMRGEIEEFYQAGTRSDEAQADLGASRGAAVTIYTTPACQGCKLTKTKLAEAGVEFTAIDLSERPDLVAQFKAQGLLSAPIIETPDGELTAGFRPDRIKSIIATASTSLHTTPTHTPEVNGGTLHRPEQSRGRSL